MYKRKFIAWVYLTFLILNLSRNINFWLKHHANIGCVMTKHLKTSLKEVL